MNFWYDWRNIATASPGVFEVKLGTRMLIVQPCRLRAVQDGIVKSAIHLLYTTFHINLRSWIFVDWRRCAKMP